MALFGTKKQDAKAEAPKEVRPSVKRDLSHILTHVRVTEKASDAIARNVYVFDVAGTATKRDIVQAVKTMYGVAPRKVHIAAVPSKMKRNVRTGRYGRTTGGKKAYVYLKEGESITIR